MMTNNRIEGLVKRGRRYIEERTGRPWSPSPAAVDVPQASIKKSERGAGQKIGK